VGTILASGPTPVTELRAAVIIGSGSISFEMIRHLTEILPIMLRPRWLRSRCQPIAIRDVLSYLTLALDRAPLGVVDVGADRLTFRRMVETYAELRGLRRVIWTVPALMPRLAARWIGAAPRQRGNSEAWMLRQPRRGMSSTACGRIRP